jgi:hypothetical protein
VQWKHADQLRAMHETAREQVAELAALRAERAKEAAVESARESASPRLQEETARLHGEIARLREAKAIAETRKRFRAVADPAIAAAYGLTPMESKPLPAGSIPLGELRDDGRASPEALLKTMRRALQHADLDQLARLVSFDPVSRAKLDGWFAELSPEDQAAFGTPDRLFAAMHFNATFPFPAESGLEVGELKQPTPDEALLHYRIRVPDGRVLHVEDFPARRSAGGWAYPVSESVVNAYRTTFSFLPPGQRRMIAQPPPSR